MAMSGMPLDFYVDELRKVPVHLNHNPVAAFDALDKVGPAARAYIAAHQCEPASVETLRTLPLRGFARLSLDEICKIRHSTTYTMEDDVENAFRKDPRFMIVNKIKSSMWRWGLMTAGWNEIVDAYDGLRSFDLGVPGFTVTLDHTEGHNACGWGEYSSTYLDGVFAMLVHHKGEHVMTIGFSFACTRKVLVQQVQLKKPRGNRWLFKMPGNRMETVIDAMTRAFPRHRVFVVDGGSVARKNLETYGKGADRLRVRRDHIAEALKRRIAADFASGGALEHSRTFDEVVEEEREIEERQTRLDGKVEHLSGEVVRLDAFYADTGRFARRGKPLRINHLDHYAIAA